MGRILIECNWFRFNVQCWIHFISQLTFDIEKLIFKKMVNDRKRKKIFNTKYSFFWSCHDKERSRGWNNNHEIKILFVKEIKTYNNISQFRPGGRHFDHEFKTQKSSTVLATFDLMIVLVTNKSIMRWKLKKALSANFNLMIVLATNKSIMRWKVFMHRWLIFRAKS